MSDEQLFSAMADFLLEYRDRADPVGDDLWEMYEVLEQELNERGYFV